MLLVITVELITIIMVELIDEDASFDGKYDNPFGEGVLCVQKLDELMTISLQSFTGAYGYQAIRVTNYNENRSFQVLIDTGSTHNFIDQEIATKLGCKPCDIFEQSVSVADGRLVQIIAICKNLQWLLQGNFHLISYYYLRAMWTLYWECSG